MQKGHLKTAVFLFLFVQFFPVFLYAKEAVLLEFPAVSKETFRDYWYNNGAEISRYSLEQARYGEIHKGEAVLIFVTERFLPDKQVKADYPDSQDRAIPILKHNFTKKFYTGVYPYSIMSSTFTPLDLKQYPHTLKVTVSVQEWCGQVYSQLNFRNGKYQIMSHSYFENEADETFELDALYLEEEVWTRIRLAPDTLPMGTVKMIPSPLYGSLLHKKLRVENVNASFENHKAGLVSYTLFYPELERELVIKFQQNFPHEIVSWQETYPSIKRDSMKSKTLTTKAVRTQKLMLDYWNKNKNKDARYQAELGLN